MSLFGLDKTATLERSTSTQDAGGGQLDETWATVSAGENARCAIWPTSSRQAEMLLRRDIVSDVVIVFDTDVGAKANDRINHGGTYYLVNGYGPAWSNRAVTTKTLFPAWCTVRRV